MNGLAGSMLRLARAAAVAVLALPLVLAGCTPEAPSGPNPIVVENQNPGTDAWQMGRPGFTVSTDKTRGVEGYASATSVNRGGSLDFHVSVSPAQSFRADIYRMGWYGGLGGRLMTELEAQPGTTQPACTPDPTSGIVDCGWPSTFTFAVPMTWVSGTYLVMLTNAANAQRYISFVVRDDNQQADLLYQQSVTTYQAYNNYPEGTGRSLYEFNSRAGAVPDTGATRAAKVSFDRPYSSGYGSGQFAGDSWNWERYFVAWMERSGYDVTYTTDLDTHTTGARLLGFKGFLSVGHDEYWSKEMFDAVTAARDQGVSLGFFGANVAYWQVRFEPSARGAADRVMVCYKDAGRDPVKDPTATLLRRDPPLFQPEQALVGVQYTAHLKDEGKGAVFLVQNSSHWVWRGTDFVDGSKVPGILGYETDRLMSEYPGPTSDNYTILSRSVVTDAVGRRDYTNSSIYEAPSGAWVFATGSNHWNLGLGEPGVADPRIERATANVLDRFVSES